VAVHLPEPGRGVDAHEPTAPDGVAPCYRAIVRRTALGFAIVLGCAGGAEPSGGPISTGVGSAGPSTTPGSSDSGKDDTTPTTTGGDGDGDDESGLASSSGDAEGSSSSSGDPSVADASSSSDDGSVPPECPNPVTCDAAEVIGMVSGDEPSDDLVAAGTDATWLTFQVTEDNDGVVGESVSFTVTLTSPASVDYDLYVYRGAAGGPTGCSGVLDSSTSSGPTDVVHMSWGEGGVANGIDDRAWVAVEIVPKNACPDGSQWSLDVEGDS
jgi:hypothetical protein